MTTTITTPTNDVVGREALYGTDGLALGTAGNPIYVTGGTGGGGGTSDASAANQTTEITTLTSIDTKTPALGQALAAASVPVILPAATVTTLTPPTAVGVNNFPATQAVSAAALPLPTGAATAAAQATAQTSLGNIDTKTPALGQALAASSMPVVLPAAQITALTPLATLGISSLPAIPAGANVIGSVNLAQRMDAANDSINFGRWGGIDPTVRSIVIAGSTNYTATQQSANISRGGARGLIAYLNVTTASGGAGDTLQFKIRAVNPVSANANSIWVASATIVGTTAAGEYTYAIGVGTSSIGYTQNVQGPLPTIFRLEILHVGTGTWQYSVSFDWVV